MSSNGDKTANLKDLKGSFCEIGRKAKASCMEILIDDLKSFIDADEQHKAFPLHVDGKNIYAIFPPVYGTGAKTDEQDDRQKECEREVRQLVEGKSFVVHHTDITDVSRNIVFRFDYDID